MTVRHRVPRKQHLKSTITHAKKNKGIQLELTAFFQTREQLGIQIATAGDSIVKITKNHYNLVKYRQGLFNCIRPELEVYGVSQKEISQLEAELVNDQDAL
jgi:hypothetical protein